MNHGTEKDDFDMHRDPITGEPGAHPIGTGLGAAGGAAAGAAAGAAVGIPGGPVGMAVAGANCAVLGRLGGKGGTGEGRVGGRCRAEGGGRELEE